jgi:acetyl-CoA C-acetyltransferase
MVLKLREGGRNGLIFANGGFATHNHTIVVSNQPIAAASFPQDFDFQAEADAIREPVPPTNETYEGPARIETYTVLYERDGSPKWGVVMARTPGGERTLARVPASDAAGIAFLTDGRVEPVGSSGTIVRTAEGDQLWHHAG